MVQPVYFFLNKNTQTQIMHVIFLNSLAYGAAVVRQLCVAAGPCVEKAEICWVGGAMYAGGGHPRVHELSLQALSRMCAVSSVPSIEAARTNWGKGGT